MKRLKERYTDFSQNKDYHAVRKPLENDERFCWVRYLDPSIRYDPSKREEAVKRKIYSPAILTEFDRHYIKK